MPPALPDYFRLHARSARLRDRPVQSPGRPQRHSPLWRLHSPSGRGSCACCSGELVAASGCAATGSKISSLGCVRRCLCRRPAPIKRRSPGLPCPSEGCTSQNGRQGQTPCLQDLSGRPHLSYDLQFPSDRIGNYDTQLVEHFFQSMVNTSGMTLHIRQLGGKNSHHIVEATFKAFARALRRACETDPRREGMIASSKGVLTQA